MSSEDWVLLHNTVVRVSDVRRIEMESTTYTIAFKVTLYDGVALRIPMDKTGGDWCLKMMEVGKKTAAAAKKEFDGEGA